MEKSDKMDKIIVITTLSDDEEVINNISNVLINNHLVSCSHISKVESSYWWNGDVNTSIEYKLEVRTIFSLYDKIEEVIKKMHNYELPEVSYYEISGSKEILNWIKENVKA